MNSTTKLEGFVWPAGLESWCQYLTCDKYGTWIQWELMPRVEDGCWCVRYGKRSVVQWLRLGIGCQRGIELPQSTGPILLCRDDYVTQEQTQPTGTEARVCADIAARQQLGLAKYGTSVEDNPLTLREWLVHAYNECLDQAVYLKRAIEELDKQPSSL